MPPHRPTCLPSKRSTACYSLYHCHSGTQSTEAQDSALSLIVGFLALTLALVLIVLLTRILALDHRQQAVLARVDTMQHLPALG